MSEMNEKWVAALDKEFSKEYYRKLYFFIGEEYKNHTVYPPQDEVFTALGLTPPDRVKVVILGQDPYHEPGQAHGLSFSVKKGIKIPPSLVNIYKELHTDLGIEIPDHGNLSCWARQGVLLLNTVLTVRAHQAMSHRGKGWEQFTDAIIDVINKIDRPIVFILWGRPAGEKAARLDNPNHLVLTSPHPSPLSASRGFFGSRPFSQANAFLEKNGVAPIDWRVTD
ncbi:MAG: uracil-DNA glycosylase [Eubacterium sp.]|nr:uracil-DNA glycosylase [Eubacterium sp.]